MRYRFPDFEHEYVEALRYREFERIGKSAWVELAKNNGFITDYTKIKGVLSNVDLDFESLDPEKKERFEKNFATGVLELPIAVKFSDTDYDLLGGNTRTAGMIKNGIDPKIWIVDMTKEKINESEKLKGGESDNMSLLDIAKKHAYDDSTDSTSKDRINAMHSKLKKQLEIGLKIETEHTNDKQKAKEIAMDHLSEDPNYYSKLNKAQLEEDCWKNYKKVGMKKKNGKTVPNCVPKETKEQTDSGSSGSFEAAFSPVQTKANIEKIYNAKLTEEQSEVDEAVDASSAGAYDAPFGNGGKNPLKIDGVKSIAKSRAVKDKNFPKWGGPDAVFVKVKDKCKKFPYCNQGINAIEIMKEINGLDNAIIENAEKHGLSVKDVQNLVSKEIKQIFI